MEIPILSTIKAGLDAFTAFMGWTAQRQALKNTTAVQAGAKRVQDQKEADATAQTIAKRDTAQIRKDLAELALAVGLFVGAVVLAGCHGTVTPPRAAAAVASWDGTNQNSGFLGWTTNSAGETTGAFITAHALERYNALMLDYGAAWQTKPGDGVTYLPDGGRSFWIDAGHLQHFDDAQKWQRNGRPPLGSYGPAGRPPLTPKN